MQLESFKGLYQRNHLPNSELEFGLGVLKAAEAFFPEGTVFDEIKTADLDGLIAHLVKSRQNTIPAFVALMRYFRMIKRHDLFIRLTQHTGGDGVIQNIMARIKEAEGDDVAESIMYEMSIPAVGTPPEKLPEFTEKFMNRLESWLSFDDIRKDLAGNNHGIPKDGFANEKIIYEQAANLHTYLRDLHYRKVAELQRFCDEKRVWHEQKITPKVVDYVAKNLEILSAYLEDGKLYLTKIPYDTENYLKATSDTEKRYYACHCPFAREAIRSGKNKISNNWCYCSAGFEKYQFELLFDRELPIKVLSSALAGDDLCRFEISLEGVPYKQ